VTWLAGSGVDVGSGAGSGARSSAGAGSGSGAGVGSGSVAGGGSKSGTIAGFGSGISGGSACLKKFSGTKKQNVINYLTYQSEYQL